MNAATAKLFDHTMGTASKLHEEASNRSYNDHKLDSIRGNSPHSRFLDHVVTRDALDEEKERSRCWIRLAHYIAPSYSETHPMYMCIYRGWFAEAGQRNRCEQGCCPKQEYNR
jgi:hypothetical protein